MAGPVSLELDPIFLKALSYLHSKSKDSAEKLKALLDESLARGSDSSYRSLQKDIEVSKGTVSKMTLSKQDSKSSSSSSSSSSSGSSKPEKSKKDSEKRPSEKIRVDLGEVDPPKKPRLEKQENRSSPITVQTSKDLLPNINDDETSADDFAMEMGLACVVCRQMTVTMGNQLVECQECHNLYHQDCHKPQVTDKEVNDPRLVWYCARCTRQMKRMAQKPPQKPSPASASSAPVVKDTLVKKTELKPKTDTASTFQAFKRTEVKPPATSANPTSSSSSSSGSGLTGWAAFGAKTSPSLPASTKLGSSGPSGSSKTLTTPSGQKPVGLSGLAGGKSGLGSAKISGSGNGNGSSQANLKPPPPLTLGKQPLNRSSSGEGQSKGSSSSGAGSPNSSQTGGNGGSNGGGNGNNGNGSKAAPGDKLPTTQESQLNAMKRLQMVKKKAAQKKLKK
ncbi:integrator complex subunit 12 [Maylandia zebra]|uniref:Integrator complex subunit 12 n=1 Tax=Maylandia zebra TaxID=106582 RepID=A0A3P9CVS4_9CICH|nr:integrator complex subunit 12 [Maylandia zebra]XP_026026995.1 integrator complex subunit 12 [Astatotilapia calliptera]XP_026026996.1 integrator complex subunit 12 [Astatotilapia calliptera]